MAELQKIDEVQGLYRLADDSVLNNYYIISSPGTRKLMASPEVVGFDSYSAMVPATGIVLKYLKSRQPDVLDRVNILTILRGGLNYPVEECCHNKGITVSDIDFMSCERVIKDGVITGLDVKYEKIHTEPDATIVIGDIIASGETLGWCMEHFFKIFLKAGHSVRKVVFFTVGGTRAISMMEDFTRRYRKVWPGFQGFDCIFYEGIFTVYEDHGVTGVNTPLIDFGWQGGTISPEFREYIMDYEKTPALLEKCIIYDGGARRYNIGDHADEVKDYWERLLKASYSADHKAFIAEKLGYAPGIGYEQWLEAVHYPAGWNMHELYEKESRCAGQLAAKSLTDICIERLEQINEDFNKYKL